MSCVARLVLTLESEQVPLPAAQANVRLPQPIVPHWKLLFGIAFVTPSVPIRGYHCGLSLVSASVTWSSQSVPVLLNQTCNRLVAAGTSCWH